MAVDIQSKYNVGIPTWTPTPTYNEQKPTLINMEGNSMDAVKPNAFFAPTAMPNNHGAMPGSSKRGMDSGVFDGQKIKRISKEKYSASEKRDANSDTKGMAEWCAQMVCYLWLSPGQLLTTISKSLSWQGHDQTCSPDEAALGSTLHDPRYSHRQSASAAYGIPEVNEQKAKPTRAQLYPTELFVSFVRDILRVTQVSRSVVTLALLYIYRLKARHENLEGQLGSEYRLFITSLVLANKFLDDHTYTNKTWSDVSHIPLKEITKMEMQLLRGIGTNANATVADYQWWLSMSDRFAKKRVEDQQILAWTECVPIISPPPSLTGDDQQVPSFSPSYKQPYRSAVHRAPRGHTKRKHGCQDVANDEVEVNARPRIQMTSTSLFGTPSSNPPIATTTPACALPYTYGVTSARSDIPTDGTFTKPFNDFLLAGDTHVMNNKMRQDWPSLALSNPDQDPSYTLVSGAPGMDPELLLPFKQVSSYTTPQAHGTSLLTFQYYRLAAGYPHGIPTIRSIDRSAMNQTPKFGMARRNQLSVNLSSTMPNSADFYMSPSPLYTGSSSGTQDIHSPWSVGTTNSQISAGLANPLHGVLRNVMTIPSASAGLPMLESSILNHGYVPGFQEVQPGLYDSTSHAPMDQPPLSMPYSAPQH